MQQTSGQSESNSPRTPGSEKRQPIPHPYLLKVTLWMIGLIVLAVASLLVHAHTKPFPVDLAVTNAPQGPHPVPCVPALQPRSWLEFGIEFLSNVDDPLPADIVLAVVALVIFLLRWRR